MQVRIFYAASNALLKRAAEKLKRAAEKRKRAAEKRERAAKSERGLLKAKEAEKRFLSKYFAFARTHLALSTC